MSARRACLCRACCPAGAWLDVCLPLKRQQWLLMTWKVLCKPSVFSVFRNGTVCAESETCSRFQRDVWNGVWSHAKAHHRRLKGSKGKMSEWLFWLLTFFGFADCYLKWPVGSWKLDSCFPLLQMPTGTDVLLQDYRENEAAAAMVFIRRTLLPPSVTCMCVSALCTCAHVPSGRCMCFEFHHKLWFTFLVSSSLLKASIWHALEYL